MWFEALKDGELTVEKALQRITPIIARVSAASRAKLAWEVMRQLAAVRRGTAKSKRGGLPTAWCRLNFGIVEDLAKPHTEGRAIRNPGNKPPRDRSQSAFDRAAEMWTAHGVKVTSAQVFDYYKAWKEEHPDAE